VSYPKRKGSIDRIRQEPLALRIYKMRMDKERKEKEKNKQIDKQEREPNIDRHSSEA
jgi:hypothetical protein